MKLKELIFEEDALGFKTTQTSIDPVTGQVTWDVEYTPLVKVDSELEKLAIDLDSAVKKHPKDEKLQQYNEFFKNFKKSFRTHVTKHYRK
jgi:hypothetical protein